MRFQVADTTTYPLSLDTIGKHITAGHDIHATCQKCFHHGRLNLVKLAYKLGLEHPCLAQQIRPHIVCRECGAKQMGFIVSPPSNFSDIEGRGQSMPLPRGNLSSD